MNPVVSEADRERVASIAGERPPGFAAGGGRVKIPAAWLIERSGFTKGHADGAVGISTKHPLALVNRGGATAADVLRLARTVKQGVADRFGVWLRPEPIFVGFGRAISDQPRASTLIPSRAGGWSSVFLGALRAPRTAVRGTISTRFSQRAARRSRAQG
jgi:hypothetical protein